MQTTNDRATNKGLWARRKYDSKRIDLKNVFIVAAIDDIVIWSVAIHSNQVGITSRIVM
jgi:hypothetical protein